MTNKNLNKISQDNVNQYNLLSPLLNASYDEIQELSKKKPESPLNNYKVKMINRILEPLNILLKDESVIHYLDILDNDDLPSNSDVVLILSQYKKAMEMFYEKYYDYREDKWNIN